MQDACHAMPMPHVYSAKSIPAHAHLIFDDFLGCVRACVPVRDGTSEGGSSSNILSCEYHAERVAASPHPSTHVWPGLFGLDPLAGSIITLRRAMVFCVLLGGETRPGVFTRKVADTRIGYLPPSCRWTADKPATLPPLSRNQVADCETRIALRCFCGTPMAAGKAAVTCKCRIEKRGGGCGQISVVSV